MPPAETKVTVPADPKVEAFEKALDEFAILLIRGSSAKGAQVRREAAEENVRALYREALRDGERLDALEREAHIEPLVLHALRSVPIGVGFRGLGLMLGVDVRRSLREAIDTAFLDAASSTTTTEKNDG